MYINIFTWDKLHSVLKFEDTGIFLDFLLCCKKVRDNREFSCGNAKPCWDSRFTIH